MEDEGVPDIYFMMRDDVAIGVYSQMSGHGLVYSYRLVIRLIKC